MSGENIFFTRAQYEYLRDAFALDLDDLEKTDGIARAKGREEVINHIEALSRPQSED